MRHTMGLMKGDINIIKWQNRILLAAVLGGGGGGVGG